MIPPGSRNKHHFRPGLDLPAKTFPAPPTRTPEEDHAWERRLEMQKASLLANNPAATEVKIAGVDEEDGSHFTLSFNAYVLNAQQSVDRLTMTTTFSNGCVLVQRKKP